ncbi:MAG TPA: F0F1 ATP synthase subunit A [Bacteroidales bacterium]|nr:F0F1 ATP synthase subunit A [Bacteroidales bacterium]
MILRYKRIVFAIIILIFSCLTVSTNLTASEPEKTEHQKEASEAKAFNPGDFIFDHIKDAYEWHVITWKGRHISIPLPVIVYSKQSGWNVFSASKFHHGHGSYKGFSVAHEGKYKGKVVEQVANGEVVRPIDISLTKNVLSLLIGVTIMLWLFLSIAKSYKQNPNKAPRGVQAFVEPLILFVRDDIAKPAIGEHAYEKYLPFLLTIFFFIWINNMLGLIPIFPGGANLTGNISITLVLAVLTFIITTVSGTKDYWLHIINMPGVPWWLKFPVPLMPIIEIMQVFLKPFVLMIRLFANITAGHLIILGFISLIFIFGAISPVGGYGISVLSIGFSIFMMFIELLVAFIQAYVFTLLSAMYFGMALEKAHH